jgi:hypothetical protein
MNGPALQALRGVGGGTAPGPKGPGWTKCRPLGPEEIVRAFGLLRVDRRAARELSGESGRGDRVRSAQYRVLSAEAVMLTSGLVILQSRHSTGPAV